MVYHTYLANALAEAGATQINIKRNIDSNSTDDLSRDINQALDIVCDANTFELNAFTVSAAATVNGCKLTGDTTLTGSATLKNNQIHATVIVSSNTVKIGTADNGNTFTMSGADIGITSPNGANTFTGLEIIDNTFSGTGTYFGIDLLNDFGTNTITITNNTMSGTLNTGIKIASGSAVIKQSDISSNGSGKGIHLVNGEAHQIGQKSPDAAANWHKKTSLVNSTRQSNLKAPSPL